MDLSRQPAQRDHRRRQHSVRPVLQHHHSGDSRRGRQFAVGRRRRLRHHCRFSGHPGREYFSKFSRQSAAPAADRARPRGGSLRRRSDPRRSRQPRLDRPLAYYLRQHLASGQGGVFLHRGHRRGVRAVVHHAGRRGPDFQPDGAHLRLRAVRRVAGDLHGHAGAGLHSASRAYRGNRNDCRPGAALGLFAAAALVAGAPRPSWS